MTEGSGKIFDLLTLFGGLVLANEIIPDSQKKQSSTNFWKKLLEILFGYDSPAFSTLEISMLQQS